MVENPGILKPLSGAELHETPLETATGSDEKAPSDSPQTGGVRQDYSPDTSATPRLLLDEPTLWALLELCTRNKRADLLSPVSGQLEEIARAAALAAPKVTSLDAARKRRGK
jgi:hypothetical protein